MSAASEKEDRARKAVSSDEEILDNRWVSTVASREEGAFAEVRLATDDTVDGMVVEISVWTSTIVNMVLYTYGRTCSGRSLEGSQSADAMPFVMVSFSNLVVGLTYDWNSLSSI